MYITAAQLDESLDISGNSPTKLIRNLLMVYFSPQVLANSSAFGNRKFPALDKGILAACLSESLQCQIEIFFAFAVIYILYNFDLEFVMKKFEGKVSRSVLVDAINDKCANYRRVRRPCEKKIEDPQEEN